VCWNRRLGSEESSIQLPDFVPRHHVGPPSGVPQRHRPTRSTGRREKLKFGRLRQRPRGWYLDVMQTDAAVGVLLKSDRDHCSVAEDTTVTHILRGVGYSVLYFWMKPSYTARITESGVSGEDKLVAQTMSAVSVAFAQRLHVLFLRRAEERRQQDQWKGSLVFGAQHHPMEFRRHWHLSMSSQMCRLQRRGETAGSGGVPLGLATGLSRFGPRMPSMSSDTILRSRRLSTTTCTVIECRGWRSTISGMKLVKPFYQPTKASEGPIDRLQQTEAGVEEAAEPRLKSRVANVAGVSRAAGRRGGV
jgi:hypothetical protein